MGSLVFGGGQVLMPMMYEQFCIRSVEVKEKKKDQNVITIDKEDMYNGMGIVRAIPGPVFSIASFNCGDNITLPFCATFFVSIISINGR